MSRSKIGISKMDSRASNQTGALLSNYAGHVPEASPGSWTECVALGHDFSFQLTEHLVCPVSATKVTAVSKIDTTLVFWELAA